METHQTRLATAKSFYKIIQKFQEIFTEDNDAINLEVMEAEVKTYIDGYPYET